MTSLPTFFLPSGCIAYASRSVSLVRWHIDSNMTGLQKQVWTGLRPNWKPSSPSSTLNIGISNLVSLGDTNVVPVQIYFCDPVVIKSIYYRATANRLKYESNTTGWLEKNWTGTECSNYFSGLFLSSLNLCDHILRSKSSLPLSTHYPPRKFYFFSTSSRV